MATQLANARAAGADLLDDTAAAVAAADRFMTAGRDAVLRMVARDGKLDAALLDREQHSAHGLAWLKVYVAALHAMQDWALRLREAGRFGEREELIHRLAFAEYLARIAGGIPMNQAEIVRAHGLDLVHRDAAGDPGAVLGEGEAVDQLLALAEAAGFA